ncbi:hypothetical protein D3C71_1480660 [compost metagenome]
MKFSATNSTNGCSAVEPEARIEPLILEPLPSFVAAAFPPVLFAPPLPQAESASTLVKAKVITQDFLNCIVLSPPKCFVSTASSYSSYGTGFASFNMVLWSFGPHMLVYCKSALYAYVIVVVRCFLAPLTLLILELVR